MPEPLPAALWTTCRCLTRGVHGHLRGEALLRVLAAGSASSICSQEREREQVPERSSCLDEAIRTRDEQIHALSEDRRGLLVTWDGKLLLLMQAAAQEAVALCSYFAGLSHKPRGGLTAIPALVGFRKFSAHDEGGASEDVGLWEPGRASNTAFFESNRAPWPRMLL